MTVLKIKEWLLDEDSQSLTLDEDNIVRWKNILDKIMFLKTGFDEYSECLSDEQWLECHTGMTPYETVMEEIDTWED